MLLHLRLLFLLFIETSSVHPCMALLYMAHFGAASIVVRRTRDFQLEDATAWDKFKVCARREPKRHANEHVYPARVQNKITLLHSRIAHTDGRGRGTRKREQCAHTELNGRKLHHALGVLCYATERVNTGSRIRYGIVTIEALTRQVPLASLYGSAADRKPCAAVLVWFE